MLRQVFGCGTAQARWLNSLNEHLIKHARKIACQPHRLIGVHPPRERRLLLDHLCEDQLPLKRFNRRRDWLGIRWIKGKPCAFIALNITHCHQPR